MEAYQKYIDSLLAKAYKIASEQITSNSFNTTEQELSDMATRVICSPSDPLSQSILHQLSVNSINLQSPGCKTSSSSAIEGQFFYQKPHELKTKPCWRGCCWKDQSLRSLLLAKLAFKSHGTWLGKVSLITGIKWCLLVRPLWKLPQALVCLFLCFMKQSYMIMLCVLDRHLLLFGSSVNTGIV